jgi:hypothetical protein
MRRWIAGKISEILQSEDDVVIELCFNLLEGSRFVRSQRSPREARLMFPARHQSAPDLAHRLS